MGEVRDNRDTPQFVFLQRVERVSTGCLQGTYRAPTVAAGHWVQAVRAVVAPYRWGKATGASSGYSGYSGHSVFP